MKTVVLVMILLLLVVVFKVSFTTTATVPQPPLIADTYIVAANGEPLYADPHATYDADSGDLLNQVYDRLVEYDKEDLTKFVPRLAENWTFSPDGLSGTFKIRSGVKFHNGAILTAEDVEYSFERAMVMDFGRSLSGLRSPAWFFYSSLLGIMTSGEYDLTNETQAIELGRRIDNAVESTPDSVIFNFLLPYPETIWLQILANPWGVALNKAWCVEHGSWLGDWGDYKGWVGYNDPAVPRSIDQSNSPQDFSASL